MHYMWASEQGSCDSPDLGDITTSYCSCTIGFGV